MSFIDQNGNAGSYGSERVFWKEEYRDIQRKQETIILCKCLSGARIKLSEVVRKSVEDFENERNSASVQAIPRFLLYHMLDTQWLVLRERVFLENLNVA